jgi:hypothetical protein
VEIKRIVSFLEVIEFLENGDGDDDIVLVKLVDTGAVVEDYIGVENEDFLL